MAGDHPTQPIGDPDFTSASDDIAARDSSHQNFGNRRQYRAQPVVSQTNLNVQSDSAQKPASSQSGPSASTSTRIIVSPRQKGNPILSQIRSIGWEFGSPSSPADYILGTNTCGLFLSLRYHKLHPEYVYTRIRALAPTAFRLRILLVLVDVDAPDDPVRALNHTCVLSGMTMILAWSAAEAARYLELYKTYEHSRPVGMVVKPHGPGRRVSAAIGTTAGILSRENDATGSGMSYGAHVVEFVTAPRSINKTDAVGIVMAFGSVKGAINAKPEELSQVAGWGQTKVRRWTTAVREPFRRRAVTTSGAIMRLDGDADADSDSDTRATTDTGKGLPEALDSSNISLRVLPDPQKHSVVTVPELSSTAPVEVPDIRDLRSQKRPRSSTDSVALGEEVSQHPLSLPAPVSKGPQPPSSLSLSHISTRPTKTKKKKEELDQGIEAALAKLRGEGGV